MKTMFFRAACVGASLVGGMIGGSLVTPAAANVAAPALTADVVRCRSLIVEDKGGKEAVSILAANGVNGVWVRGTRPGQMSVLSGEYVGFYKDARTGTACDFAAGVQDGPFVQSVGRLDFTDAGK